MASVKFVEGGEDEEDEQAKGDEKQLSLSNLRWTIGESEIVGKITNGKWPMKSETLDIKSTESKNLKISDHHHLSVRPPRQPHHLSVRWGDGREICRGGGQVR
jgi:hypothetical protein